MKIESMEQLLVSDEFKKEREEVQAVVKSIVGKYNTHADVQTVRRSKIGNEKKFKGISVSQMIIDSR